jgi:glycosyltransferase involved in cell wall biosynthesis
MGAHESCSTPEAIPLVKRRIRLLYILDSIWGVGGAELCLLRMIPHVQQAGYDCHVLTFHSNEEARSFRNQFSCPVEHWQLKNVYDYNALRIALRLRKFIREHKIDIVHTFFETADLWAGSVAKLSGVNVLISSRRDMGIMRAPKHHIGYRLLRGIFDQVQTVSEGVRRYTIETDGVNPHRTVTIYNGVEKELKVRAADVENLRERLGIVAGMPVITCVANLRRVKGIDVLVRAAALVKQVVPQVRFLIAGHFGVNANLAYTEEMIALSKSLNMQDSILFLGQLNQVPELLNMSDVFLLPSRSEGFSNALLEAMAAGVPCVATAVGGNPEVVIDGVTGYLVPKDDHASLADRILTLLQNPNLRHQMGFAARSRIMKHFTVEIMASQVISAYDRLLKLKCGDGSCARILPQPNLVGDRWLSRS